VTDDQITRAEDIIWRKIGDEIVVIKDDGLAVHVLNKTAAHIWEMCNGDYQPDQIADSLCEHFDVSLEEASTDVKDIIEQLRQMNILKLNGEVSQ
jgi:hypothetical protein